MLFMECRIMQALSISRAATVVAATTLLAVFAASRVGAQTITDPGPKTKPSSPPVSAKLPTDSVKSCSIYGAGFVYVPATGACIKIGGYVETDGTTGR